MNQHILQPHIQEFIKNYIGDITKLAFSGSPFPEVTVQELIQQIEGRNKATKKLSFLLKIDGVFFPPKLNIEQTSSQQTALYKASLIAQGNLADLTGGLGIDSYFFSKKAKNVTYFELNKNLYHIAQHNFAQLNACNISAQNKSGLRILDSDDKYDTIYIDPSRRTENKQKVFFLNDCEPNVPEHINNLLKKCNQLLLKTSPMLDIQVGLKELKGVYEIHVVAVNNEVKEILWLCNKEINETVLIKTINLKPTDNECFDFILDEAVKTKYGNPLQYLYEPNPAILKAGGFSFISSKIGLTKLHKHSHLFTSETLVEFPGRRFKIEQVIHFAKKEMKASIAGVKANVTTRNFPETVASLRKKWKIKDGGTAYLFFTTLIDERKVVLICSKI